MVSDVEHVERVRDLRMGGSWTPLQRVKNDALWALAVAALAVTRSLPRPALLALGRGLGRTAHSFARGARLTALANVARALPELDLDGRGRFVLRCFVTLGEMLGETVAMLHDRGGPPPLALDPASGDLLREASAGGRGVVFASAHLGPWERVAASLVAEGVPLVTLAREAYDPRFSALYERLRGAHGVRVIWRSSPGAAARILRTLRRGEVLGVPMDLRARVASLDVPFLGHLAPTASGPARIALRTGAAVVVGTAAPAEPASGLPLRVTATRVRTDDLGRDDAGARALTGRINAELSRRILAFPSAWVWMHDRW